MKLYVRMRGGLGNQMFQYGYALALRERYPKAEIVLDTREYATYKRREFELGGFVLGGNTSVFTGRRLRCDLPVKLYHVYQRLYREVRGRHPSGVCEPLSRRGLLLTGLDCPLPASALPEETFLYGYFENAGVLLPIRDRLRAAYSLPEDAFRALAARMPMPGGESAAVSVRLGQDIVQSGWQLCTREYYRAALEEIRARHDVENLYVFSDAPERLTEEKWFDDLGLPIVFAAGLSPVEQMAVLSRCRHFVISNSTFAWWGAFLGARGDSRIIAPRIWQGNVPTRDMPLYYDSMTLL